MRKTIIDIGTNTILLLIADYNSENNNVKSLIDKQWVPRLGKSVEKEKIILPESFIKAKEIIKECIHISKQHHSKDIKVIATSFLREAKNKNDFISEIKRETNLDIEVLDGYDEAKYSFIGGMFDIQESIFPKHTFPQKLTLIDIGGGSTEVTSGTLENNDLSKFNDFDLLKLNSVSIDSGAVNIKERFFKTYTPSQIEIKNAEKYINERLNLVKFDISENNLIGVAGTITTLGGIKLNLKTFDKSRIDNSILSINELEDILKLLSPLGTHEILQLGDFMVGREDIIVAGALILKCFMQKFGFSKIKIRTTGLRYGVLLRECSTGFN